jgi:hypothetical protein
MFVDYYIIGYTKHQKMFSKKCVLENDFFLSVPNIRKRFLTYFQGYYQTQENELVFQKIYFGK